MMFTIIIVCEINFHELHKVVSETTDSFWVLKDMCLNFYKMSMISRQNVLVYALRKYNMISINYKYDIRSFFKPFDVLNNFGF